MYERPQRQVMSRTAAIRLLMIVVLFVLLSGTGLLVMLTEEIYARGTYDTGISEGQKSPKGAITSTPTASATGSATSLPTQTPATVSPSATPTTGCPPAWHVVNAPAPGENGPLRTGVAVVSESDVWAVGSQYATFGDYTTLTEHWDGTQWSVVTSPNGPGRNTLKAVAAISTNDVWAVGRYGDGASDNTLAMHWDGTAWRIVPTPQYGSFLYGVAAVSANDVWAVGSYITEFAVTLHWDGSQWSVVNNPFPPGQDRYELHAVTAVSADDVWAVGSQVNSGVNNTLIEHWNGTQWSLVDSPYAGDLRGIAAVSADDVWAVGSQVTNAIDSGPLIEHWNGTQWSAVNSPNPSTIPSLSGVAAVSANDVWAVGYYVNGDRTLIEHWDGTEWSIANSPNPGINPGVNYDRRIFGIDVAPANDLWAVGGLVFRFSTDLFSDVQPSDYFHQATDYLYCRGAISGYSDGTFRPYNDTTRSQSCKIVVLAEGWAIDTSGGPHFSDVPNFNPFYQYVETAYHHGVISGYSDGTFRWGNYVTRGQTCKIIVSARGWTIDTSGGPHFSDVPPANPFYQYIETAYHHGAISGYSDGTFRPGNNETRGQISKIVYLALSQP